MRRYDYTIGAFIKDESKEQFSAYSIVDGMILSTIPEENYIYDQQDMVNQ